MSKRYDINCKDCEYYETDFEAVDMDTNEINHYHVCLKDPRRPMIVEEDGGCIKL